MPRFSLQRLTSWLFCAIIVLLVFLSTILWDRGWFDIDAIITTQFEEAIPVDLLKVPTTENSGSSDIFDRNPARLQNEHITPFATCPVEPNPITNAIRLPHHILNISLASSATPNLDSKYFNPTLIPLPPHSPYPYLLLSRLVTEGLHQESHVCLATLCQPQWQNLTYRTPLSTDAHACTESDIDLLGPEGGIRCATIPEKLNIPPTPARRCEGAWAAFPDIPGFHDPRVFWSGKGEPLVIVNSASRYGCVGLWIVDLRAVYPEFGDLTSRKGKYVGHDGGGGGLGVREADADGDNGDDHAIQLEMELARDRRAVVSYPHLTELTRNRRQAVEKNWILFFPKREESWVLYDLVKHGKKVEKSIDLEVEHGDTNVTSNILDGIDVSAASARNVSVDGEVFSTNRSTSIVQSANKMFGLDPIDPVGNQSQDESKNHNSTDSEHGSKQHKRARSSIHDFAPDFIPSRTLAKIIGSGYTTNNLTSTNETPCLTSADTLDSLGHKGHWHQGSNSLRLILCSRYDWACLGGRDENRLVEDGKILHFAVLHRKFSNDLKLPMRYERYIMVWEARFPFRMVGISRYPILFADERAQPWSEAENGIESDAEANRWASVYFTYTPSLAWSWRKESVMADGFGVPGLGTGYLGDEVIVGIGMDDVAQGFVKVKVDELLNCLRLCPDFEPKDK